MLRNITKNFSVLFFARVIYRILLFVVYMFIARFLGVEQFGQISLVISFVWFFNVFIDFGLTELFVRDTAAKEYKLKNEYIANILGFKIILSLITYSVIIVVSLLIPHFRKIISLNLIIGLALIFNSYTIFLRSIFQVFERMEYEAFSLIVEAFLTIAIILGIISWFPFGILTIAQGLLVASFITTMLTMVMAQKKFVKLSMNFDLNLWKRFCKRSAPFMLLIFFGLVNFKVDIIMLSWMLGDKATGWFSVAIKIIEPVIVIPFLMTMALFPVISRLFKDFILEFRRIYDFSIKGLFLISIFFILMLYFGVEHLIFLLFGKEFLDSIIVAKLLSLVFIPFFLKFFIERTILVVDKPRIIFITYLIGTSLNVVLNLFLIQVIGCPGAAISTLISEFIIVGINFCWLQRYLSRLYCLELKN